MPLYCRAHSRPLLSLFFALSLCGCASQPEKRPVDQQVDLARSVGQNIQITGKMSVHIAQHPLTSMKKHTAYMDFQNRQIVLYSDRPVNCKDTIIATGTLRLVDLGGPKGTRDSYSGYHMDLMDFICK